MNEIYKIYKHNPPHLFRAGAVYIVTASTYGKRLYMAPDHRKRFWWETLIRVMEREGWKLIAWVVLSNHYHVLMQAPETGAERLPVLIGDLHRFTARRWNEEEGTSGRRVWWNYWDTCITYERSYYARLNYIHWNPVRHGVVKSPEDYEFSSYRFYLDRQGEWLKRIEKEYPFDRVNVFDPF
jgi:putative transposase